VSAAPPASGSGSTADAATREPWYRRRGVLLAGGVAVILVAAVLTDLPTTSSTAANVNGANAFVKEVNADLAPCAYALTEAYDFRRDQLQGSLTATDRSELPTLLSDDRSACSLEDPSIQDLTTGIESPGTSVQNQLGLMLAASTRWVATDATAAVGAIQALSTNPSDAAASGTLVHETLELARDRAAARAAIASADARLDTSLYQANLPSVVVPTAVVPTAAP
jgi:hypothetical protein